MSNDARTASSENRAQAEIVAIADDWARAIVSNDPEQIASFMADDWVIVSESGINSKAQYMSLVISDEWTTDVFVRRDGRWLCVLSQITAAAPA
jgi:ketosteroid isomerase-like protein